MTEPRLFRFRLVTEFSGVPAYTPFSEAQFKTLKYRTDFPERFGSIELLKRQGVLLAAV